MGCVGSEECVCLPRELSPIAFLNAGEPPPAAPQETLLSVMAATCVRAMHSIGCSTGRQPVAVTATDGKPVRASRAAATAAPSPAAAAAATPSHGDPTSVATAAACARCPITYTHKQNKLGDLMMTRWREVQRTL